MDSYNTLYSLDSLYSPKWNRVRIWSYLQLYLLGMAVLYHKEPWTGDLYPYIGTSWTG